MQEKRSKKRRKAKILRTVIVILCVALAALLFFYFFFRLKEVKVSGNVKYTEDQIRNLCSAENIADNTLLFIRENQDLDISSLPFLDSAEVYYLDPNTAGIKVREKKIVGFTEIDGRKYCFDRNGILVEIKEKDDKVEDGLVTVSVPVVAEPAVGKPLFEGDTLANSLTALQEALQKKNIVPDLIEVKEDGSLVLHYGQIRVDLGDESLLEEKVRRAAAILPQLTGKSGELHLETFEEGTENIIFSEDQ